MVEEGWVGKKWCRESGGEERLGVGNVGGISEEKRIWEEMVWEGFELGRGGEEVVG